jgi:hypothetical protein
MLYEGARIQEPGARMAFMYAFMKEPGVRSQEPEWLSCMLYEGARIQEPGARMAFMYAL